MPRLKTVVRAFPVLLLTLLYSPAATTADLTIVEAVKTLNWAAFDALLKRGADVNRPQPDGTTALHWAAYWNNPDVVERLIRAGARPNATNELGATALWIAAGQGSTGVIDVLLKAGADPNAALEEGETALMAAARSGVVESVTALLARGANPNAAERVRGQTALMW